MTKQIHDDCMDAGLEHIADNGDRIDLVSQAPATWAEIATYTLGHADLTTGVGGGDYTLDNGSVSGRRLVLGQKIVAGTDDGTATHAVISDSVTEKILHITTAPNYNMSNGVNQTVPAFDVWEIKDPT